MEEGRGGRREVASECGEGSGEETSRAARRGDVESSMSRDTYLRRRLIGLYESIGRADRNAEDIRRGVARDNAPP